MPIPQEISTNRKLDGAVVAAAVSALVIAAPNASAQTGEQPIEPVSAEAHIELAAAARQLGELGMQQFHVSATPLAEHRQHQKYKMPGWKPKEQPLPYILQRIGGCESNSGPNSQIIYTRESPVSDASGGFQFLKSTWNNFQGYAEAKDAPPRTQRWKAKLYLESNGTTPWNASRTCWD
jgi:hypothetical protein